MDAAHHALHPTTAVILMTAFDGEHRRRSHEDGAFDYAEAFRDRGDGGQDRESARGAASSTSRIPRGTQSDIYESTRSSDRARAAESDDIVKKREDNTTVLFVRTGTGRTIAGAIHHNSLRAARNFVKVNCAALQENLPSPSLRPREGLTGADSSARPVRAGRRRLAVPRRSAHEPEHAGENPALCSRSTSSSAGRHATLRVDARLIAATNRSVGDGSDRPVPRGPALPPERRLHRDVAAA